MLPKNDNDRFSGLFCKKNEKHWAWWVEKLSSQAQTGSTTSNGSGGKHIPKYELVYEPNIVPIMFAIGTSEPSITALLKSGQAAVG